MPREKDVVAFASEHEMSINEARTFLARLGARLENMQPDAIKTMIADARKGIVGSARFRQDHYREDSANYTIEYPDGSVLRNCKLRRSQTVAGRMWYVFQGIRITCRDIERAKCVVTNEGTKV